MRFLNMAAHELNTPLTPLRLQVHLLRSGAFGKTSARQQKAIAIMARNLERLHGLVQEILDVARMEGGGLRTKLAPFDLRAGVQEALDAFAETARQLGVDLRLHGKTWHPLPADVDATPGRDRTEADLEDPKARGRDALIVLADRARVLQIVQNLVSNALKFTPRGGRVNVTMEALPDAVLLRVRDTGAGLSPEQLGQLFRPFARPLEATAPDVGGTGLGLFIARGLAQAMGGSLIASSPGAGKGATFTLTLAPAHGAVAEAVRARVTEDPVAARLREIM